MIKEKIKVLGQILGCYFHQDWPDEFDSDDSVFQAITEFETVDQIQAGLVEIDMLLSAHLSENELRCILTDEVGCYFDPVSLGLTYEQWLKKIYKAFSCE